MTLVTLVIAALVVWLVAPLREVAGFALRGDASGLRGQLRDLDTWGVLALLAVMVAHAVIWYPAEILTAAAGFVYGFALALPIVVGGWLLSALATYAMGRYAGRPLLHRIAGERRFRAAERTIDRGGAPVLLAARLVPVIPFSLTGYVAGAAHVPLWRFSWTTVAGFLPMTLVVVFLGSRLEELSLTDPLLYLALAPIGLLALAARPVARRMQAPAGDEPVTS
ncbi:MAG: VTT domain-containing protein [Actinomycetota bacterium]|nr:VTT domain-containing protein [Actinomycetota bacterium]